MKRCRLKRYNFQIINKMNKENETFGKPQNGNDFIANVMHCLSSEIEEMHYQKRDRTQCYLQQLLYETKQKGNLAEELISALEMYLNK